MPEALNLKKAELIELKPDFTDVKPGGKRFNVQFNPDSLKVTFTNQIATPNTTGSQRGTPGQLHVGAGSTKLALQLWFDASLAAEGEKPADVRDLTKQVSFFITPQKVERPGSDPEYIPPAVQFLWGTFHFDGIMDSLEETLDYWSHDGKPLRATVSLSMSQQKIEAFELAARRGGRAEEIARLVGAGGATSGRPAGTTPLAQAPSGSTLQGLADNAGRGGDWQSIAAANGIENPRLLQPGQLLNLNPVNIPTSPF